MAVADRIHKEGGPDTATDNRQPAAPAQAGMGDDQLIARLHEGYGRLKRQVHQVIVGQDEVIDSVLCCMLAGGHCIVQGVPGLAKTLLVHSIADAMKLQVQPDSVHAGPDALRHHRGRYHPERPAVKAEEVRVHQGPDLRQYRAGRRDQPHAAQDAGRPVAGDAGTGGDHLRQDAQARPSRSSSWPRRTRSSRRAPIRCPRPHSTASCSWSTSTIRRPRKST